MTNLLSRRRLNAAAFGLVAVLASGCAVEGGGGYYGADYGVGYYEPGGAVYGGWGADYRVAPFRGGGDRRGEGERGGGNHAYRSAPSSHATPSLPSRSSGGARGGGSRR